MPPPIPIDKSPLIMAGRHFVFWNQPRTGLLPLVSNNRVVRWSKAAIKVNQRVQTWQVLLEPTQPDSFAWIWNSVGKTSAETCQVLIWIGIGAYTARTASMDMKFDRQYLHGDLLDFNQAYADWIACLDMKPGTQASRVTPPSSNLTGLTRAYATWLACMDIKPVRQDFYGGLSGFNIYWLSPEPTLPSSNLTGLIRAYATWLACRDMKPVRQDFDGDLSGFNIYWLSPEPTLPSSNLTGLTRAYTTLLACMDMRPDRQNFYGDLSGFIIFTISNSCSRLVCLWSLSSTTCLIWKYEGLVQYELVFQHSHFIYMECLMA